MAYRRFITALTLFFAIDCSAIVIDNHNKTTLQPGCYIANNSGYDTILKAVYDAETVTQRDKYFASWRGIEGTYLVLIDSPNNIIELQSTDRTETDFSTELNPCPGNFPIAAAQSLTDALDIRLRSYLMLPADERDAHPPLQSAFNHFTNSGLSRWIAHSAFELAALEFKLAQLDSAQNYYQIAYAKYAELEDIAGAAAALNMMGQVASRKGSWIEADEYLLHAKALRNQLHDNYYIRAIKNNLGNNAMYQGEYPGAIQLFEQALSKFQGSANLRVELTDTQVNELLNANHQDIDLPNATRVLINIANYYDRIGQEYIAEMYLRNAYALSSSTLESDLTNKIRTNLGRLLFQQGHASEALNMLLPACNTLSTSSQPYWAKVCLTFLGQAQAYLGDYESATEQFQRASQLTSQSFEEDARTLWYQGELFEMQGLWIKAQKNYQSALYIYGKLNANSSQAQQINSSLGQVELQLGQVYSSLQHQQEALKALEGLGQLREAARARSHLGLVYATLGDLNKSHKLWLQALEQHKASQDTFAQLQTLERLAHHAASSQQQRHWDQQLVTLTEGISNQDLPNVLQSQFFANQRRVYERLITGYINENQLELAWQTAESARARGFTEHWQNRQQWFNHIKQLESSLSTPDDEAQQQQKFLLRARLLTQLHELNQLNDSSNTEQQFVYTQIQNQLLEVEQQLAPQRLNPSSPRIELAKLQQKLKPGQGLLSYFIGESSSFLWLIENQQVHAWQLPKSAEISQRVAQLRETLSRPSMAPGLIRHASASLADMILKPAAAQLEQLNELIIQADGELHALPFALLEFNQSWLIQRWNIRYAPSNVLLFAENKPLSSTRIAVMADPDWRGDQGFGLVALPGSAEEAYQLRTLQQQSLKHWQTDLRVGKAASRDFIINGGLSHAALIHISTHGLADLHNPVLSALAFSDDDSGQPSFLRLQEIASLQLDAALVTLSGCGTANGKIIAGEGSLNLARPFLLAGANSVLANLWNVNDSRSVAFIQHFYQRLLVDRWPASQALSETQRWAQRQPRLSHPYYWASYVLVGQEVDPKHWSTAESLPEQYESLPEQYTASQTPAF